MAEIELRGAYTEIKQLKDQLEAESGEFERLGKLPHIALRCPHEETRHQEAIAPIEHSLA